MALFTRKKEIPEAPAFENVNGLRKMTGHRETLDRLATGQGEAYDAAGCPIKVDAVVAQLYHADPYQLCVRLGGEWYAVMTVPRAEPALANLPIETLPTTPHKVAKAQEKAERERQQREAEEAYREERRQYHLEMRRRAEERRQQAAEENKRRLA